jgi:hypothetical protein
LLQIKEPFTFAPAGSVRQVSRDDDDVPFGI